MFSSILMTAMPLSMLFFVLPSVAQESHEEKTPVLTSYSTGQLTDGINQIPRLQMLEVIKNRVIDEDNHQVQNKALTLTRDAVIKQKQQKVNQNLSSNISNRLAKVSNNNANSRSYSYGNFVIYEGYAQLIEDLDIDGYYQTFSVTFDADFISYSPHDKAIVYAELYLSENGGPWQHYYTTDSFIIHGESSDDNFEVYSTLSQGYNANHYDVLIDLYEEGYPNIVASYSSDDNNALYGLPLESSDYDIEYYEEVYVYGGSSSIKSVVIIFLLTALRKFRLGNKVPKP